jgi:hypothetical protein
MVMRKDENGIPWMHTGDEVTLDGDGYLQSELFIPIPWNLVFEHDIAQSLGESRCDRKPGD